MKRAKELWADNGDPCLAAAMPQRDGHLPHQRARLDVHVDSEESFSLFFMKKKSSTDEVHRCTKRIRVDCKTLKK